MAVAHVDPELLVVTYLPRVRQFVERACWRRGLRPEVDDVISTVVVKLVSDNYAVVRVFDGRGPFDAYLSRIVDRVALDYQRHLWGTWRPSALARRLGTAGVMLDRLISRDQLPVQDAVLRVASQLGLRLSDVTAMGEQLATRPARNGIRRSELLATQHISFSSGLERAERRKTVDAVNVALSKALGRLTVRERALLRMRYVQELSVREIATHFRVEQKQLYRLYNSLLRRMRQILAESGVDTHVVFSVLDDREATVEPLLKSA